MAIETQTASGIYLDTRTDYRLPDNSRLNEYVKQVIKIGKPGILDPDTLVELTEKVDVKKTLKNLPPALTEEDFLGVLMLSLTTECATDTYGKLFNVSGTKYKQPWYNAFTNEVWVPDETTHRLPFHTMLLQAGYSEAELNKRIKEAQEVDYYVESGSTPVHMTAFGTIQEYITDNHHGLQYKILLPDNPEGAQAVLFVKRRETLHTVWNRDMTALQIEENPEFIMHVAEALPRTKMPANQIAPDLQTHAPRWLVAMEADFDYMKKHLIELTIGMTKTPERTGQLVMNIAKEKGVHFGPMNMGHIIAAMNKFDIPGYGLIGESLMVTAGMGEIFTVHEHTMVDKIRGSVRNWLASQIENGLTSQLIQMPDKTPQITLS